MKPLISYVVTVYNKKSDLPDLLDSLRSQAGLEGANVEFIFADDMSTDGSVEYILSEAARDPRIKLIENSENLGPAVRINQAASEASGSYIIPLDADDYLPKNASKKFLDAVRETGAPLVFGRSQRGGYPPPNVDEEAEITVANDALAYCARKKIVRMGFMVERSLWTRAQGADERIFIQDQSLPLRLSAHASRLAFIHDVVYWLRPVGAGNLSRNTIQQHHDRFFAMLYQIKSKKGSTAAKKEMYKQLISARWKLQRELRPIPFLSGQFLRYLQNKAFPSLPIEGKLDKYAKQMSGLENIRRREC